MFDIGSRDEKPDEVGLAHLWEHMAFKGTQKRSAYQVLTCLDVLGGELNAFTTKEKICFHASILEDHFDKALDLVADIAFYSIFPEKELEKEKKVVLEEISMYYDSPDDAIQDDFETLLFAEHPMGNNILGTIDSVPSFGRQHFQAFIDHNMATERTAFVSTGSMDPKIALRKIKKRLEAIPRKNSKLDRLHVNGFQPKHVKVEKPIQQAHCMIGGRALSVHTSDKYRLMLLNNILGGPASNALLNLSLREKYGFVYSVESNYHAFTDTGAFQIYFATEKKQVGRCFDLATKEMLKLDEVLMKKAKLEAYKQQIKGQLAMSEENNQSYMLMIARSLLDLGKIEEIETVFAEIDSTTADELIALRRQHMEPSLMASLTFLPA
jgi:predicted Zn-dependent peptidase